MTVTVTAMEGLGEQAAEELAVEGPGWTGDGDGDGGARRTGGGRSRVDR